MALKDYYKEAVYHYGYDMGWLDRNKNETERLRRDVSKDIFYQDEEDYYICADYLSLYGEFSEEDKKFLEVLGFREEDFEED